MSDEADRALAELFVQYVTLDGWDAESIKARMRQLRDEAARQGKKPHELLTTPSP